jgi:UTP-glucose-1-phosphate uridylyltransferase
MQLFVPGRICLVGEHSDWAGGYRRINPQLEPGQTLITGTDQGLYAEVSTHPSALVLSATAPDGTRLGPVEIPMEPGRLLEEAQKGGFWSYIAGVAYQAQTNYQVRGLVLDNYQTDLPIKKGLSSSAAICVLAARAFNRLYDLKLTVRGEMELAYQGEITTPSLCGRMDQGCAFGKTPVLMTFDGDRLETRELHLRAPFHFVLVDLQAQKDTREILRQLNHCYPNAETDLARGLHQLLGPLNRRIVHQAIEALETGQPERLGALMTEAQKLFDRYAAPICPRELTAPALHRLLGYGPLQPLIWGGKGVGSQGDGTAQLLCRSAEAQQAVLEILERELQLPGLPLTLAPRQKVRKAVIPVAGFGTRLFPASKAAKKEFFPIVDRDGIAKPAILLIVEEALNAGIEEVILVVQPTDLADFKDFFSAQLPPENFNKLPQNFQACARRLLEIGRHLTYVIQTSQEGFGHAVFSAAQAVGDEPFLLMLGDHIYRSNSSTSCARQLLEAYEKYGTSLVGLRRTPEAHIANFGTLTGLWQDPDRLLTITEFAEKPTPDYARANLRIPGLPEGEYLTVFGQYVLKPDLFGLLKYQIDHNLRDQGEVQLTPVLERLRQQQGFLGLLMDGQNYDIGLPGAYLETLQAFSQP